MTDNMPTGETMSEGSTIPPEQESLPATIEASVEALGGAKVGDTISLKVESIDEQTGTATLVPAGTAEPKLNSIDQAAGEFEK